MTTIGFTGTREGMTDAQKATLTTVLRRFWHQGFRTFVQGCCVGADAEAVIIAGVMNYYLIGRPSNIPSMTSKGAVDLSDELHTPEPPLGRNCKIVADATVMIACLRETKEQQRSGTWYTVRQARRIGKPLYLILPDGTEIQEEPD